MRIHHGTALAALCLTLALAATACQKKSGTETSSTSLTGRPSLARRRVPADARCRAVATLHL